MRDPLELQIRAMRAAAEGIVAQADALLAGLGAEAEEAEAAEKCPGCGSQQHQAKAGNVTVCGDCGANYGEVSE